MFEKLTLAAGVAWESAKGYLESVPGYEDDRKFVTAANQRAIAYGLTVGVMVAFGRPAIEKVSYVLTNASDRIEDSLSQFDIDNLQQGR